MVHAAPHRSPWCSVVSSVFLHGLFNFFYLTICSLTHGNLVSARLQDSR